MTTVFTDYLLPGLIVAGVCALLVLIALVGSDPGKPR